MSTATSDKTFNTATQESRLQDRKMHSSSSSSETSLVGSNRPKTIYFHGGIGGAGNYRKVIPGEINEPTANPHARQPRVTHLPRSLNGYFSSGVGGAGNMHTRSEEAALTNEEEIVRARILENHFAKRWFVGIGGKGNRRDARREHSPGSDLSKTTTTSSNQTHIGAAEALKRKLLGRSRS